MKTALARSIILLSLICIGLCYAPSVWIKSGETKYIKFEGTKLTVFLIRLSLLDIKKINNEYPKPPAVFSKADIKFGDATLKINVFTVEERETNYSGYIYLTKDGVVNPDKSFDRLDLSEGVLELYLYPKSEVINDEQIEFITKDNVNYLKVSLIDAPDVPKTFYLSVDDSEEIDESEFEQARKEFYKAQRLYKKNLQEDLKKAKEDLNKAEEVARKARVEAETARLEVEKVINSAVGPGFVFASAFALAILTLVDEFTWHA